MIHTFVQKFLQAYDYDSMKSFLLSMCPSFKYNLQIPTITVSSVIALLSEFLGFGPVIVVAMAVAVVVETLTGIKASKKQGKPFESFRFSRCVIKVVIWLTLVYIANSFSIECSQGHYWIDKIGVIFFEIIKLLILAYFVLEYVTSILENLAVLDGKPKTYFIESIQGIWSALTDLMKTKIKKS